MFACFAKKSFYHRNIVQLPFFFLTLVFRLRVLRRRGWGITALPIHACWVFLRSITSKHRNKDIRFCFLTSYATMVFGLICMNRIAEESFYKKWRMRKCLQMITSCIGTVIFFFVVLLFFSFFLKQCDFAGQYKNHHEYLQISQQLRPGSSFAKTLPHRISSLFFFNNNAFGPVIKKV